MNTNRPFSRRTFLQSASALTATAPFLLLSRLWAAETPPSDRLALGFIGVGTQGRGLMGGFLGRKEVQVLAVCDCDTTRREAAKKRVEEHYSKQKDTAYKGCAAYNDFRDLLARNDIDAVVIATPDHWHALIAITAANAGKDIYCEKPMSHSIHEAKAMIDAVRKNKRVFQTGSMQRSSKEFRTACELVRNGRIGKIEKIIVSVGGPGRPCDLPTEKDEPGLDWDLWLGPAPVRGYNSVLSPRGVHSHFPDWRAYREYGGGMITDWGAHHFDIAQWGMGMDESGPVEIFPPDKSKAQLGAHYKYANGVEVFHDNGPGVAFFGSEGKIEVNRGQFRFWLGKEQKAESPGQCDAITKEFLPDGSIRLYKSGDHGGDWLACVRSRQKPICDVAIGASTVIVCHLVNLAYYHGQKMQWDPKKLRFVGGTGDPKWLDDTYRGNWNLA
jgi:predicted dehydrogenase